MRRQGNDSTYRFASVFFRWFVCVDRYLRLDTTAANMTQGRCLDDFGLSHFMTAQRGYDIRVQFERRCRD